VRRGERPALLRDPRHVRPGVVDPDDIGRLALREEDGVRLHALAVRGEGAAGETEHGVEPTVLGEDLEDLARLIRKQTVVRQDDSRTAALLQHGQDVLDEVELLVRGRDREVVPVRRLVRALRSEWRVSQHAIEARARRGRVDRVTEGDTVLDAVEIEVHEGEAPRSGDELVAGVDIGLDSLRDRAVERVPRLGHEPLVGGDEKPARAGRGIMDREVPSDAGIRLHAADHRVDEDARGEELPGALLALGSRLLE